MIGFAASENYPVALALLFAAGFLELTFNAMAQTLVQLNAHEEIRGRTLGLFKMASLGRDEGGSRNRGEGADANRDGVAR